MLDAPRPAKPPRGRRGRSSVERARAAAAVRLERLEKRFGQVVAVDGITLTIPAGSFFALLGPSGCGKTTTLRMIGGLEEPTAGQIFLDDEEVTHRKPYRRPVNTVFQNYALFPHLSIFENVAFGLRRKRVHNIAARVEEMLALVELAGYGGRRPSQLSGGQQQRVALARALINEPKVLLLDEPLGALDLKLRRQMQLELKRIQLEVGTTFVHVTHDQEEAMTMADEIAVMNAGRVEQKGTPAALYDQPATAFVANFLGQSNLLPGRVVDRDDERLVIEAAGERLAVPRRGTWNVGDELQLGVRPEKIRMARGARGGSPQRNELRGVVHDVSFVGVSTEFLVGTPDAREITVFAQNLDLDTGLVPGESVVLQWDPAHTFCVEIAEEGDGRDAPGPGDEGTPLTPGDVGEQVAGTVEG